jgi:hypothetical protein
VAGSVALKETATQVLKDKFTPERINAVSEGIWNMFTELVPQEDIMESRQLLCNKLQRHIQTRWPRTQLELYGSSGNNLCSKDSAQILKKYCSVVTLYSKYTRALTFENICQDLDLCLLVPAEILHSGAQRRSGGEGRNRNHKQRHKKEIEDFINLLAGLLRTGSSAMSVFFVLSAFFRA